ncbi:TetR/AcrR family transcriptional regulator [Amycolatopsis anabasis]|uniref:TetR/AcrR family transcriptional regulator n=1 Tax=Amycolatopsis anabasis TaxID=1840409 RepID=UPI00131E3C99|nr:TetR family transcriptional regulator [Amycolatopsis anabasis]
MTEQPVGRRERKKAQTRRAISDAALRLFLERGYDQVSVKDVADAADVAVTTLFKHFPGKEALVFDEDANLEAALVAAVRDRAPGVPVVEALREHLVAVRSAADAAEPEMRAFLRLVESTPALREYGHRMWMRHEAALARAIAETTGAAADDLTVVALAHFALQARSLVHGREDPARALNEIFARLADGWGDFGLA